MKCAKPLIISDSELLIMFESKLSMQTIMAIDNKMAEDELCGKYNG